MVTGHTAELQTVNIELQKEITQRKRAEEERARLLDETQRNLARIRALHQIDRAISSTLNLQSVLEILLELVDRFFDYPTASAVRIFNQQTGKLESLVCRNMDHEEWKARQRVATAGRARTVVQTRLPLIVRNVQTDPNTNNADFYVQQGLVSYLAVPVMMKESVIGILGIYTKKEHEFSEQEVEFLTTLAGQAAIAIHNAQLYQDLEKSNKVKTEFLGVMSHELRTPLIAIMGYAGLMEDEVLGKNSREQAKAVRVIRKRADDLLVMIRGILEATKIEAGSVVVEKEEVDLRILLDDLRETYIAPLDKQVRLRWDYDSDLPVLRTDVAKLRQIMQNLINNAIKFTDHGEVIISAKHLREANRVELRVADTGIGIAEEMLPVIFEKFRQVDSSDTRLYEGVGLGLYIVKEFTELVGGKVKVESEPGKGSVFTFLIPCSSQ